jgi:polar amino acid transport system substrate-binding protein
MKNQLFTPRPNARLRRAASLAVVAATIVVAATGCAQSGSASPAAPTSTDVPALAVNKAAAKLLPAAIASQKVLTIAIPTNEPPTQFYAAGTQHMTGVNPDIARLIGEALGIKVDIKVANFDSIIPGIAAGRYDMTVSSMTPTNARMKVLDFVDYMQIGSAIAVQEGNPLGISQKVLCGRKVGLLNGSYQMAVDIPNFDKACVAAGKPAIQTNVFQDTRQAISALTSGRLDGVLADSPIVNFAATQDKQIVIVSRYDFTPVSVGAPKGSGLLKALSTALNTVITSDSYRTVLKKYGLEASAITDARVNFAQG